MEREAIIRTDDACDHWEIYAIRNSRAGRKLVRLAQRLGIAIEDKGHGGVRFRLPLACVRFVRPREISERQLAHLRAIRERRFGGKKPD
jgi:hypothetical protein